MSGSSIEGAPTISEQILRYKRNAIDTNGQAIINLNLSNKNYEDISVKIVINIQKTELSK